ncbi:MAG: TonB family protein [Burkholderiales bacterium]|nr:TonB family protein [Burkholderiales bacterium]MBI3730610.1 TonB family protein [Burkholderiales bacterium]
MSSHFRLYAFVTTLAFALVTIPAFAMEADQAFAESGCEAPTYDQRTLTDEEEGLVKLNYLLDDKGTVVDVKIVGSSGFRKLDKASLRALKACRFQVGATPGWNTLAFAWTLK